MSDPLFKDMDEQEREYAPQQTPEGRQRAALDGGSDTVDTSLRNIPPEPAPVASAGSSPSSTAAPPNIGHEARPTAPGDPQTEAEYPMDDRGDERSKQERRA